MNFFIKLFYSLFLYISINFFFLSNAYSDQLDIILGATTKHYCTCIFISNLSREQCDKMFDRSISNTVTDSELIETIKQTKIQVNQTLKEVAMSTPDKSVKSVYAMEKGCHLDNLNQ